MENYKNPNPPGHIFDDVSKGPVVHEEHTFIYYNDTGIPSIQNWINLPLKKFHADLQNSGGAPLLKLGTKTKTDN